MPQASIAAAVILLGVTVVTVLYYMLGNNQQERPQQYSGSSRNSSRRESYDCEDCTICCYPFSQSGIKTLPCKHRFHAICIEKWKSVTGVSRASCPFCRAPFT